MTRRTPQHPRPVPPDPPAADLPEGWATVQLNSLADTRMGKTILSKELSAAGVPVFSAGQANEPWGFVANSDLLFDNRTVVLSARGSIGFPKLPKRVPFVSTQTTIAVQARTPQLARYLRYWLDTVDWTEETSGATIPMLTVRQVADFFIPLPPLAEQKRIVAKVEELLARVDAARERLAKVPAILKRFRQSVLAAACSGRLTEEWREQHSCVETAAELMARCMRETGHIQRDATLLRRKTTGLAQVLPPDDSPREWTTKTVRELLAAGALEDFQDGNHGSLYPRKTDFADNGVTFLTAAQVFDNRVHIDQSPRLAAAKAKQLRIGLTRPRDVLLTHNATVGRVAVMPDIGETCILGTSVTYYRFRSAYLVPEFCSVAMQSERWQSQLRAVMEQTTRNQVSVNKQVEFWLVVPPLPEQHEIVRRVERLFALADSIEKQVAAGTARVEKLAQSILAKVFRGELVPTEAELARREGREYEAAEKLLERIQEARHTGDVAERKEGRLRQSKCHEHC